MATKTLTITEDAYNLLKSKKLADESFSEEIMREMSEKKQKRPLRDFYGILSKEDGDAIMKNYWEHKKFEVKLQNKRMKELWN